MTARLTVYSPVLVMMPARIDGTASFVCKKRGDKARRRTGQHGQRQPQERVARHGGGGRHGAAQRERTVGGHIGDVQHAEAQKSAP